MHDYFAMFNGDPDGTAELECMKGGSQLVHVVCMLELKTKLRHRIMMQSDSNHNGGDSTCRTSLSDSDVCEGSSGDAVDAASSVNSTSDHERVYEFAFQPAMSMAEK